MLRLGIGCVLSALLLPQPASAQFVVGPAGGGYFTGGGLSLNYHGKRLNISAALGRSSIYQYGLIGPPVTGGYYGYAPVGPWVSQSYYFGPPPFVVAPPVVVVRPPFFVPPALLPVRGEDIDNEPRVPNPDRFIIIRPDKPKDIARVEPPNPPARVEKVPKEVDLGIKPAQLPLAPAQANARVEADRQLEQGSLAFSRGEFGVALERFRRAAELAPEESSPRFLLAQTQFAVGKYDEAAANIAAGLKFRPDWPMSRFQSRDLYRLNPAAYDIHLLNLRDALAANPDDPRLLLVLGVELWFDDKRDEARPLFAKAAKLAKDPATAEAFLRN